MKKDRTLQNTIDAGSPKCLPRETSAQPPGQWECLPPETSKLARTRADRLAELEAVATEAWNGGVKKLQTYRETLLTVHDEGVYVVGTGHGSVTARSAGIFLDRTLYRLLKVTRFDLAFQPLKAIPDKKNVMPERKFQKKKRRLSPRSSQKPRTRSRN